MMGPDRLKAFSDGVLAIIITIMVLELRVPHDAALASLRPLVPVALSYVLSFVYLVIYWNNHHHLLHVTRWVTGGILWANAHLLFWLSLVPFVTAWMGENHFAPVPTAAYGVVLFLAGVAYEVLQRVIIASQGPESVLAAAVGADMKGKLSPLGYALAVPLAFVSPWAAGALYVAVALMWLTPDRRIERTAAAEEGQSPAPARKPGRPPTPSPRADRSASQHHEQGGQRAHQGYDAHPHGDDRSRRVRGAGLAFASGRRRRWPRRRAAEHHRWPPHGASG